jgi:hypothetical protein
MNLLLSQPVNVHIVVVVLPERRGAESTPVQMDHASGRTLKLILKQQYGLKTLEEQRLTGLQLELYKEKQKKQAALKIANNEAFGHYEHVASISFSGH